MSIQSISSSLPPQGNLEASTVLPVARLGAPSADMNAQPAKAVSKEQLNSAIKSVREYIQPFNNKLEFSVNDETDQVVVKIVDMATKEVIRQIPSEEMLAIAKALDSIKGLFLKQMA